MTNKSKNQSLAAMCQVQEGAHLLHRQEVSTLRRQLAQRGQPESAPDSDL